MYSNKIFEIFKNPSNAGGLQGANGIGKYVDEICGDFVKIYLKIDDDQTITEARFKTMGSVGTIVASSAVCSLVLDSSLAEAQELTAEDILEVTGEYPVDKMYSLDFAIRGLNLAIADYYQRMEKDDKPKRKKSETLDKPSKTKKVKEAPVVEPVEDESQEEDLQTTPLKEEVITTTSKKIEETTKEQSAAKATIKNSKDELFDDYEDEEIDVSEPIDQPASSISLDKLAKEEDVEANDDMDDYDDYDDLYSSNEDYYDDKPTTIMQDEQETALDPVDLFLRGGDSGLEVHNLSSGDRISIKTTTEETVNIKASRMVEESKTYAPVIETKIIRDEYMKKTPNVAKEEKKESKVSKAKAMFDAMFEE